MNNLVFKEKIVFTEWGKLMGNVQKVQLANAVSNTVYYYILHFTV